jgi:hypothetical protein
MRHTAGFAACLILPACLGACGDASSPHPGDGSGGGASGGGASGGGAAATGGTSAGGLSDSGGRVSTGGVAVGSGGASEGESGGSSGGPSGGAPAGGAGSSGSGGDIGLSFADWDLINGVQWADTDGNPIQAHGGGILKVGQDYFWFGENRNPDGTFFAVSVYRSRDLMQWEFRNHVLELTSDPELDPANIERPKVVYNELTGKYVMWMHWENGMDYGAARAAVASSDTVDGDYTYHGSFRPYQDLGVIDHDKPGYMSRDCTLFVDTDGTGYFLSATNENYDLNLYQLSDDYLEVDHLVDTLFPGGHREAPALFERHGVYYLLTSGATGWDPNQAQYATSDSITSGWSSMQNVGDGTTFHSQSTYVLEVGEGGASSYLYLGDRWAGAYGGPVNDSTYVWQPINFGSGTQMSMSWNDTLYLRAQTGVVEAKVEDHLIKNEKSGLYLGVEGESTADGAALIQTANTGSDSLVWALDYTGSGAFRLTNQNSDKVLDVPDESTADGVLLGQWEGNGGEHQAFVVVDIGQGRYRIRNVNSGKFVGVVDGSTVDGAGVEQRALTEGNEQVWRLEGTAPDGG